MEIGLAERSDARVGLIHHGLASVLEPSTGSGVAGRSRASPGGEPPRLLEAGQYAVRGGCAMTRADAEAQAAKPRLSLCADSWGHVTRRVRGLEPTNNRRARVRSVGRPMVNDGRIGHDLRFGRPTETRASGGLTRRPVATASVIECHQRDDGSGRPEHHGRWLRDGRRIAELQGKAMRQHCSPNAVWASAPELT